MRMYIESSPTKEFIAKMLLDVDKRIDRVASGFQAWAKNNPDDFKKAKNPLSTYNALGGMPKLKIQLKALKFLLNQ